MLWLPSIVLLAALGSAAVWAQSSALTARELFYREDDTASSKAGTAARKSGGKKKSRTTTTTTTTTTAGRKTDPKTEKSGAGPRPATSDGTPVIPAAGLHFGVRYNVLQITDRETRARKPVDPDSRFRAGDCVAVDLTANRDGFVYVFNQSSTGKWQALLPSPEMPEQSNAIRSGRAVVVPSEHCFEFDSNPGVEKLLVVLTEREEDQRSLGDAIRRTGESAPQLLAVTRLNQEIELLRERQLIGRDIKIAKIGAPKAENETPHSVYAVRASAAPDERLVIEIELRHD
jgi:hypothetical protein